MLSKVIILCTLFSWATANQWTRVRGTAQQISARGDIMPVWIVNAPHELLRREFTTGGWEHEHDNVANVGAAFDGSVWIVTRSGGVRRGRNSLWQNVEGSLVQVAGRSYYEALGVNSQGDIFHFIEEKWRKLPGSAKWAGIGVDGAMWVINAEQQIFHWNHDTSNWTKIDGAAVNIDVYSSSRIVVTNKNDEIFTWTGTAWKKEDGKCIQASITMSSIFCIRRPDHSIYRNN